jgi:hypothetical protein
MNDREVIREPPGREILATHARFSSAISTRSPRMDLDQRERTLGLVSLDDAVEIEENRAKDRQLTFGRRL